MRIRSIILIVVCFVLSGCATYMSFCPDVADPNESKIYWGTREWIVAYTWPINEVPKVRSNAEILGVYLFGLVDMPLSFAFDTLLLPYTIPNALFLKNKSNDLKSQKNINHE